MRILRITVKVIQEIENAFTFVRFSTLRVCVCVCVFVACSTVNEYNQRVRQNEAMEVTDAACCCCACCAFSCLSNCSCDICDD